jgi:hypothetical protein
MTHEAAIARLWILVQSTERRDEWQIDSFGAFSLLRAFPVAFDLLHPFRLLDFFEWFVTPRRIT